MTKKIYIPVTLDVDRLLERYPPEGIKNFSKDKMLFIVHSVAQLQAYRNDPNSGGDYVPLNSTYLQSIAGIRNYNQYVDYLVDAGVFGRINSHVPGVSSRVYKFRPPYDAACKAVELQEERFIKSLERDTRKEDAINQYKNLWQWFNRGKLNIDRQKALELNDELHPLFGSERYRELVEQDDFFHTDFTLQNQRMRRIIENVHAGDPDNFHFTVDTTAGRLHTLLTNMNKEFRQFLTYGGRPLASCDVKCCQPYLSLLLFRPEFYQMKLKGLPAAEKNALKALLNGVKGGNKDILTLGKLSKDNDSDNNISMTSTWYPTIILVKQIAEDPENALYRDVEQYKQDILASDFYSVLRDGFNSEYGLNYSRDDMKELWAQVAFGEVKHDLRTASDFHKFFAKRYPTVMKVYDSLKADKYQTMAHLLQRIEAHIVLKVTSKQITMLKPRVVLYSIHDCLISTVEHIGFVKEVMAKELHRLTGEMPKLDVERWTPDNLLEQVKVAA